MLKKVLKELHLLYNGAHTNKEVFLREVSYVWNDAMQNWSCIHAYLPRLLTCTVSVMPVHTYFISNSLQKNFFSQVNQGTESSAIFKINFWRHNWVQYSSPKVSICFVTRHMVHFWYIQTFFKFKNAWLGLHIRNKLGL